MSDNRDWVVWNGSIGIVDMTAPGRVEAHSSGRNAWLAPPYDIVGPFSLDELETLGRVAFGACLVMSRQKWREEQDELRLRGREERRSFAVQFAEPGVGLDHRQSLGLPAGGELTAAEINSAFRRLAKTAHPDAGGSHDAYIRLTKARDGLLETAAKC